MKSTSSYSKTQSRFRPERLPSPQSFYWQELGKLRKAGRDRVRCACPFHKGKNQSAFSINLSTGAFNCFNCGAHGGDVVSFVMLRDRMTFKEAAQSLGAWDDAANYTWAQTRQFKKDREHRLAAEAAKVEAERQTRIEARDELHLLERCYDFANRRLSSTPTGTVEAEHCWQIMTTTLPMIREADLRYRTLAGVEIA